jgi:hypothetical protein
MFRKPNKRGVSTFVIGFIFFYSVLGVLAIVYANSNIVAGEDVVTQKTVDLIQSRYDVDLNESVDNVDALAKRSGIFNYLRNMVIVFANTPWWIYAILFTPLIVIVVYAVFVDII